MSYELTLPRQSLEPSTGDPHGSNGAASSPVVDDSRAALGAEGGSRPQAGDPSAPGLVGRLTTRTFVHLSAAGCLKTLNRQRRYKRMRKGVIAHADAVRDELSRGGKRVYGIFITLTYADPEGWRPEHIGEFVSRARKHWARRGLPLNYEWVVEATKAGVPHYHLLVWAHSKDRLPKPDDCGWWPHGMSNIQRARKAVGYMVKYASKGSVADKLPVGARIFGTGGNAAASLARHRACLPRWLREKIPESARAFRVVGVGWGAQFTDEVFESPFYFRWGYDEKGIPGVQLHERGTGKLVLSTSFSYEVRCER